MAGAGDLTLKRDHSWTWCAFAVSSLALCIITDILQYAMPLAFLPSVLEDRGHSVMRVTTAIGVYYWTGFLGGALITGYQIWRVLYEKSNAAADRFTVSKARRQVWFLVVALGVGTLTLCCQATWPTFRMHTGCRFIQGFAGAFIFFYAFLLAVELFQGTQQVFALTAVSCSLNVAEVLGSGIGAVVYDEYGHRSVFWFLACASALTQVMLIAVVILVSHSGSEPGVDSPLFNSPAASPVLGSRDAGAEQAARKKRLVKLLMNKKLILSVLLITTAASVKGVVEEALPFHADHEWGFEPLMIGKMFTVIALAYITAAVIAGKMWTSLASLQIPWCSLWLAILGMSCWGLWSLAHFKYTEKALYAMLVLYGTCLGMTHTPAALLVAEAIEEEEEGPTKDAANGIWNTAWEAGGSIGFLVGGLLSETYYSQLRLMGGMCVICICAALLMVSSTQCHHCTSKRNDPDLMASPKPRAAHYGSA